MPLPEGMPCATVKVKSGHPDHVDGFVVINADDFDPAKHERFMEPGELPPPPL